MNSIIFIDTMYLVVKYPFSDLYDKYFPSIKDVKHHVLKKGIPTGDFVLNVGVGLYRYCVCQHGARVYLSSQVEEKVGEDNGLGIHIQLGPKFLIEHSADLHSGVDTLLSDIGLVEKYPIKITRVDLAMDLLGVPIKTIFDLDLKQNWVGRSKLSSYYYNTKTGHIESISIGKRNSSIFLRMYDKVAQANFEGDIEYWRDIWKGYVGPVTRIEWEVKPTKGNFEESVRQFELFSHSTIRGLLLHLFDWGRICVPDLDDSNRRRWEEAEIWKNIIQSAQTWLGGVDRPVSRYGKKFHGIGPNYAKQVSGYLSGVMARLGDGDPSLENMLKKLNQLGEPLEKISKKAVEKYDVISRM